VSLGLSELVLEVGREFWHDITGTGAGVASAGMK
jgi:hypothetical protein